MPSVGRSNASHRILEGWVGFVGFGVPEPAATEGGLGGDGLDQVALAAAVETACRTVSRRVQQPVARLSGGLVCVFEDGRAAVLALEEVFGALTESAVGSDMLMCAGLHPGRILTTELAVMGTDYQLARLAAVLPGRPGIFLTEDARACLPDALALRVRPSGVEIPTGHGAIRALRSRSGRICEFPVENSREQGTLL